MCPVIYFFFTEEMTDPASQPLLWISRWVDYSDKYGFGYQLCDEGFGVMFNDNTRILLHPNQKYVYLCCVNIFVVIYIARYCVSDSIISYRCLLSTL